MIATMKAPWTLHNFTYLALMLNLSSTRRKSTIRWLYYLLAIVVPFSLNIFFPRIGLEVVTPAELLIACLFLLMLPDAPSIFGFLLQKHRTVFFLLFLYLFFSFVSVLFSTNIIVSVKALAVELVFITTFLFGLIWLADRQQLNVDRLFRLHAGAVVVLSFIPLSQLSALVLDRRESSYAAHPFFNDHTEYGAALVFALTWVLAKVISRQGARTEKLYWFLALAFLFFALFASYSRAAWLSICVLIPVLGICFLYTKRRWIAGVAVLVLFSSLLLVAPHLPMFGGRSADANAVNSGLVEQLRSIADFNNDESNAQRVSKWRRAWSLFMEHPFSGTGPGTFQFQEFPQSDVLVEDASRITRRWGIGNDAMIRANPQTHLQDTGTAHNEFLLRLSERGIMATLCFALLLIYVLSLGLKQLLIDGFRNHHAVYAFSALLTYSVHALVNNFLSGPKLGFLFWASVALALHASQNRQKVPVPEYH